MQRAMVERNVEVEDEKRIRLRIGINLGDVVVEGEDILGDGVNVAARLEAEAEPDGICVSDDVMRQVRDRLDLAFVDGGERELKNIVRPVRVWHWADAAPTVAAEPLPLPLPDKPSIAVLPFDNMSGDPEQEYFADGIAEDVITALSRFRSLFVIARNSSFTYKGGAVNITQVARELGVRYVVEGSVRKAGNRVRITAQLIDAASDHHIWAERYDRELDDIFAVQDDITGRIAMAVAPELYSMEMARARRKNLPELGVWEIVARANWHLSKFSEKDTGEAEDLLRKALELDPDYAGIHVALSGAYSNDGIFGWQRPQVDSRALALEMGERAVDLDNEDEHAHAQLGISLFRCKRHEEAAQRLRTAIKLNPNHSFALSNLGRVLVFTHNHDEGLELLHRAMQLSPKDPMLPLYLVFIGLHHFIEKRYGEARVWAVKALHERPSFPTGYRLMASANGMLGDLAAARAAVGGGRVQRSSDCGRHRP